MTYFCDTKEVYTYFYMFTAILFTTAKNKSVVCPSADEENVLYRHRLIHSQVKIEILLFAATQLELEPLHRVKEARPKTKMAVCSHLWT